MTAYLVRRLMLVIPTIIGITLTIHIAVRMIPGDVVDLLSDGQRTEQDKQALREQYSLNQNVFSSYVSWLGEIAHGDLGTGILSKRDIGSDLAQRFPVTLELAVIAVVFATVVSIPVGVLSAVKQESLIDHAVRSLAVLFVAVPSFWFALMVYAYGFEWFGWTPPLHYRDLWDDPVANLKIAIVPGIILSASLTGTAMRLTRSAMLEVLRQDYVRTARAKGLAPLGVVSRHALRNAIIPIITVFGVQVPILLGGTVVLESIFSVPGMGSYLLEGLTRRDYAVVQAVVLLTALIVVVANIAVDLSYSFVDPRVRYSR